MENSAVSYSCFCRLEAKRTEPNSTENGSADADDVDKEFRPAMSLIAAWIGELARIHDIDATLLGTRQDIMDLLRPNRASRLSTGWRAEMVGRDIERILSGEAGLSFDGHGRLRLLPTTLQ